MQPRVQLTLPPTGEFMQIARLATVALAHQMGFVHDEIEDLRIAVDELCSLLTTDGLERPLHLTLVVDDGRLEMIGKRQVDGDGPVQVSLLTERVLKAALDGHQITTDNGTVSFSAWKQVTDHAS